MIGDGEVAARLKREGNISKSSAESENSLKELIDTELSKVKRRVEDLEDAQTKALPIPQLTPSSDLEAVKHRLNYIINYINGGIKYD